MHRCRSVESYGHLAFVNALCVDANISGEQRHDDFLVVPIAKVYLDLISSDVMAIHEDLLDPPCRLKRVRRGTEFLNNNG